MMIAAAANKNDMTALIPDTMENARGVMLFDLETDDPPRYVTEDLARHIVDAQCEALLCGFIYDADFFETIAQAGITRYLAAPAWCMASSKVSFPHHSHLWNSNSLYGAQ